MLAEIVEAAGLDKQRFFAAINDPAVKRRLFDTTDELIGRGGFGSPTFFLDGDDMYFGNDPPGADPRRHRKEACRLIARSRGCGDAEP